MINLEQIEKECQQCKDYDPKGCTNIICDYKELLINHKLISEQKLPSNWKKEMNKQAEKIQSKYGQGKSPLLY